MELPDLLYFFLSTDQTEEILVRRIVDHPQFNKRSRLDFDMSILELSKDLTFWDAVAAACLPRGAGDSYAGAKGT